MRRSLAFVLTFLLLIGVITAASAGADTNDNIRYVRLIEGKSNASYNMGAIRDAVESADSETPLTIMIAAPGTYYVGDGMRAWRLRSNTTVDLNGATLIRYGDQGNLFQNCDPNGENTAIGGYDLSCNITLKNGTMDGADDTAKKMNLCNFGHAKNIRLENMVFKNGNSHLVELSGCSGCVVSNCTFTGYTPGRNEAVEALQLDISDNDVSATTWNGIYYSDSTVCRNITVENCTFLDFPSGVGNHKGVYGNHNTGIVIRNNRFNNTMNTKQPAIWSYDFDNCSITGNTVTGNYEGGVYLSGNKNTTVKNNSVNTPGIGIYVTAGNSYVRGAAKDTRKNEYTTGCVVENNTVTAYGDCGVIVSGSAKVTNLKNNTVKATGGVGLKFANGAQIGTVSGNKIAAKGMGIQATTSSVITNITGNPTVTSTGDVGINVSSQSKATNIKNNTVKSSAKVGMLFATGARIGTVSGNSITAKSAGIQVTSSTVVNYIYKNPLITSTADNGVFVSGATAKNISGNTVKNCRLDGISVSSSGVTSVVNANTVTGCGGYGIKVNNAKIAIKCQDNKVSKNKEGTYKLNAKVDAGKPVNLVAAPKITAIQNALKGVCLAWKKVSGAAKYRVFCYTGSAWKFLGDTVNPTFLDKTIKSGQARIYTVRCLNDCGRIISPCAAYKKMTFLAPPALPTLKNTKYGVQISFKKPAGATRFRIYRKVGGGAWTKLIDTKAASYLDKTAKKGVTYRYTVRCIDKNGSAASAMNNTGRAITCKR